MKLMHYSKDRLGKEILNILEKYIDASKYHVFFFGSRVSGKGGERSDIDIGIKGEAPIPTEAWLNIKEEIENFPILYKLEIVDFSHVAPKFSEVAMEHIETIKYDKT